ncbi:MAG: hypothetical protein JKY29_12120 [Gammaproteobacteria bacterium]|nr:hypothetical protein [Gammaproteobacteria bacterium]
MKTILYLALLFSPLHISAQEIVVFGIPNKVIAMDQFGNRKELPSSPEDSVKITKIENNYYWENRNNTPMTRTESTIYITYTAIDGSGYVTIVNDTARELFLAQPSGNVIGRYTYVEHIISGLTSRTIYGR